MVDKRKKRISDLCIKINGTAKDVKIIITALQEYAERHPKPKCDKDEAECILHLIEYQVGKQVGKNETLLHSNVSK